MSDNNQKPTDNTQDIPESVNENTQESVSSVDVSSSAVDQTDYQSKWLRAQADYANLVKETAARRGEWAAMSEAQVLEDFLPVYDNFCKAFSGSIDNGTQPIGDEVKKFESWKKGIEYIMQQFWTVLKNHGVEKIETIGKMFDPSKHESVGEEACSGKQSGEIIREVDPGYIKHGKVLKVAKVIIVQF